MGEDTKFKKLATQRMNRCIKMLRLIGNLSNKSIYSYSSKEANKMIAALQSEVSTIKAKFLHPAGGRTAKEFDFND